LICIFALLIGLSASVSNAADPGLVAWWKLDDEGTGMITDSSRNGHNGTLHGDVHFVPGIDHEAVAFDGVDD